MTQPLRLPALYPQHQELGAKFASFGGWEMPLEYAGVIAEHTAVRTAVGVFDVSHLGKARLRGVGAVDYANRCLTNDLDRIGTGQAQYTLCCAPDGGVVDDLIAYRFADDHVFLVPNAANTAEVVRRLAAGAPPSLEVTDEHEDFAVLAVQGPRSPEVLAALGLPADHEYMSFAVVGDVVVCRTGYTGEHGYELVLPAGGAAAVWSALLAAGAQPCGLAARDTLRTEMGYPLHGQDLSPEITPVQARSGWAVGWTKPEFWGRDALLAEKAVGPRRLLYGIESLDRGIPRPHMAVLRDGAAIGLVTSGTFSPTKRVGIGLALLDSTAGVAYDDEVELDVRGRRSRMRVVKPPFVKSSVR
jgi:aminomethyltransferase